MINDKLSSLPTLSSKLALLFLLKLNAIQWQQPLQGKLRQLEYVHSLYIAIIFAPAAPLTILNGLKYRYLYEESPRGAASSRTTCHFFWVTSQVSPGLLSHANGLKF